MTVSMLEARPAMPEARASRARQEFRQRPAQLLVAMLQTLAGTGAVAVLALGLQPGVWGSLALAIVAAIFLVHFGRAVVDHLSRVALDDHSVSISGPLPRSIAFDRMEAVTLRYFSTRRDGEGGWMQIALRSGKIRIALDSDHPAFDALTRAALFHARRTGVPLSPATLANARALAGGAFDDRTNR
jgi:hypothetical protein